jgi:hypothetical protein
MSTDLPKPAVAKGRLVKGFPKALAPPKGTTVESSSVSVARNVVQAALVATGGDPQAILTHYRTELSTRGFAEQSTQSVENAPAAAFTKGDSTVTVTTLDGKTYMVANLRVDSPSPTSGPTSPSSPTGPTSTPSSSPTGSPDGPPPTDRSAVPEQSAAPATSAAPEQPQAPEQSATHEQSPATEN